MFFFFKNEHVQQFDIMSSDLSRSFQIFYMKQNFSIHTIIILIKLKKICAINKKIN